MEVKQFLIIFAILYLPWPTSGQTDGPDFCATAHFDGAYYFELELVLRSGKWSWAYDKTIRRMKPLNLDQTKLITTTLFIDRVPDCTGNVDCPELMKALDLLFLRSTVVATGKEYTDIFRVRKNGRLMRIGQGDLPWKISQPSSIWPISWSRSNQTRASLFYPSHNDAFFIEFIDGFYYLLTAQVNSQSWFLNMHGYAQPSGVHYVGMFHTSDANIPDLFHSNLYAIGHAAGDHNKTSHLYYLNKDMKFQYEVPL